MSGFKKCGTVFILNPNAALSRLPQANPQIYLIEAAPAIDDSVMDMLREMRQGTGGASTSDTVTSQKRKKRLQVEPGKSISNKKQSTDRERENK